MKCIKTACLKNLKSKNHMNQSNHKSHNNHKPKLAIFTVKFAQLKTYVHSYLKFKHTQNILIGI